MIGLGVQMLAWRDGVVLRSASFLVNEVTVSLAKS